MGAGIRVCALIALAMLGAPAAAHATLVTAQPDGVLAITAETVVSSGGSGFSGVLLDHTTSVGQPPDPTQLVIRAVSRTPAMPEMLHLAAGSEAWCHPSPASGPVVSISCAVGAIDHITADLGDGDDFLLAQAVTDVGDHTIVDPVTDPALIADLGAGDDEFVGGPLAETIEDGIGADNVSGYAPDGGGNDLLIQPDVADPAVQDAGDLLDTDYDHGVVDYSRRTHGQGVSVTTRSGSDDGAPGENDSVTAYGVRGTRYDDTLIGNHEAFFREAFFGDAGHDIIDGRAGADDIHGGDGPDDLTGGAGADTLSGDAGDDTLHADDKQADGVACGTGSDTVRADRARDVVEAAGPGGAGCEAVTLLPTLTAPVLGTTKPAAGTAGGATRPPTAPSAAPAGATATLKGGRARIDRTGRVKLAFACPAAASCARRAFLLKVKVGRKTYTVVVKVKALAAGRRGVMTAKLPKRLAAAVRRAGKQGLKARLGTKGAKARTLMLTSG